MFSAKPPQRGETSPKPSATTGSPSPAAPPSASPDTTSSAGGTGPDGTNKSNRSAEQPGSKSPTRTADKAKTRRRAIITAALETIALALDAADKAEAAANCVEIHRRLSTMAARHLFNRLKELESKK